MHIGITETVLRDANQSLIATRLQISQFEEILNKLDEAGYYSLECWGGATFDACIRYLEEDPWERLRIIRKHTPNTKLQMLLRGKCLLGYRPYPDDLVRRFVYQSVENGIDIVRIFDALNSIENIAVAVEETLRCGAHPSGAIVYTESPVHDISLYVKLAVEMERIGVQSVCIKDMSGILAPLKAYHLIKSLKENISIPIILHSHCTGGLAYMTYLKAIEAGIDVLDTAISSFSGGTSLPPTEVINNVAKSYGINSILRTECLSEINTFFSAIITKYHDEGVLKLKSLLTDPDILESQIPGGMYSNLMKQLNDQGCIDKLGEVVKEIPLVRKDLGYPPLVTPMSQMVATQSVINVISGVKYSYLCNEVKSYLKGEYGFAPGEINSKFEKLIALDEDKDEALIWEQEKKRLEVTYNNECDILTCLIFPRIGEYFIQKKYGKEIEINSIALHKDDMIQPKNNECLDSSIEPDYEQFIDFDIQTVDFQSHYEVKAVLSGIVKKVCKFEGDEVSIGESLLIFESMKMEIEVPSPLNGNILKIHIQVGDTIKMNDNLMVISVNPSANSNIPPDAIARQVKTFGA